MPAILDKTTEGRILERLQDNWSPTRIVNHLKNLGIIVSRQTIYNVKKARGKNRSARMEGRVHRPQVH